MILNTKTQDDEVVIKKVDMLGQELSVGDLIAYGIRSGNTGEISVYEITSLDKWPNIQAKLIKSSAWGTTGRKSTLQQPGKAIRLNNTVIPKEDEKD